MGDLVTNIILVLSALINIIVFASLPRNNAIYEYRIKALIYIVECINEDLKSDRDFRWRLEYLDSVSYDSMVLKLWKDIDDFYPNKAFITKGTIKDDIIN